MQVKNLYVVDDDEIFQFMITRTLDSMDQKVEVKVCSNGEKAITELKKDHNNKNTPDIILLDINMPVLDGWEFLKLFKRMKSRIDKAISIYIVSSSVDPQDILKAQEIIDVSGYVVKPLTRKELKNLIEEVPQNHWIVSSV